MEPRFCRRATTDDMLFVQALCISAQDAFFPGIRRSVEWTPELRAKLLGTDVVEPEKVQPVPLVCPNEETRGSLDGTLLMELKPGMKPDPAVKILGIATADRLPREERIGIGLSLLLTGVPFCLKAGIRWGYGHVEATNGILLETLRRVNRYHITESAHILVADVRQAAMYDCTLPAVDDDYVDALKKAIAECRA